MDGRFRSFLYETDSLSLLEETLLALMPIIFPRQSFGQDDSLFLSTRSGHVTVFNGMPLVVGELDIDFHYEKPMQALWSPFEQQSSDRGEGIFSPREKEALLLCSIGYQKEHLRVGDPTFRSYKCLVRRAVEAARQGCSVDRSVLRKPLIPRGQECTLGYRLSSYNDPVSMIDISQTWLVYNEAHAPSSSFVNSK